MVGRSETSNLVLASTMFPEVVFQRISKTQFKIEKDVNDGFDPVYITDMSRNGTFLNGDLIGQGNRRILGNRDSISIVQGVYKGE
jgi:serine/threonine-protein kinase CHEK2